MDRALSKSLAIRLLMQPCGRMKIVHVRPNSVNLASVGDEEVGALPGHGLMFASGRLQPPVQQG